MFNGKRMAALERQLRQLQNRVLELEGKLTDKTTILSTEYTEMVYLEFGQSIRMPKRLELRHAVQAILDHFGVQLKVEKGMPATPERLVLQKPPKKGAK